MHSVLNTFSYNFSLVFKIVESLQCILKSILTDIWKTELRKVSQQTPNVVSTLVYVEITSRLWSTWYPRIFNVDLSMLVHWSNSTLKQRWFWVDSKNNFVLISWCLKSQNLNVDKVTVFQRGNNVNLLTSNQRWNLTLKQRWSWVDSKTQFCSYITILEKLKLYINVEKITVFQRRKNVSLSTLNQRRNLRLKQCWFWVGSKNIFVLMFCSNFDGRIIDVILMHIFDSTCFFWCVFKRKKSWLLCPLLLNFRYFKNESRLVVSFRCNLISMYFFKVISLHFEISYVIIQCSKVHEYRFENLPICSCSYKNNTLKISHS